MAVKTKNQQWKSNQRGRYRRGELTSLQIELLEKIPMWWWKKPPPPPPVVSTDPPKNRKYWEQYRGKGYKNAPDWLNNGNPRNR